MKTALLALTLASFATAASASWIIDWSESDARRDRNHVRYTEQLKACKAMPAKEAVECIKLLDAAIAREDAARTLRRI